MRQDAAVSLGDDCLLVRCDGEESAIEDTATPIHDIRGQVIGAVILFHSACDVGQDVAVGAARLAACVPDSDTVCRYGGDEFVVLLPEVACSEAPAFSADQLLAAIAMPHRIGSEELRVTAGVGVSACPVDGTDAVTLLRKAQFALLRAKSGDSAWSLWCRAAGLWLASRCATAPTARAWTSTVQLQTSTGDAP
jgi:predicted signal transduction protein with EAL and GGDEF domain